MLTSQQYLWEGHWFFEVEPGWSEGTALVHLMTMEFGGEIVYDRMSRGIETFKVKMASLSGTDCTAVIDDFWQ